MLAYSILCILLVIVNFACLFLIRSSRTFAIYPGYFTVIIFLTLGVYLTDVMTNASPAQPPQIKNYKNIAGLKKYEKDRSNFIYENMQMQVVISQQMKRMEFILQLFIFQCFLALIAAVIGSKLISHRRKYYYWICALYVFLVLLSFASNYLIYHHRS
jgi:hypothetical protein